MKTNFIPLIIILPLFLGYLYFQIKKKSVTQRKFYDYLFSEINKAIEENHSEKVVLVIENKFNVDMEDELKFIKSELLKINSPCTFNFSSVGNSYFDEREVYLIEVVLFKESVLVKFKA